MLLSGLASFRPAVAFQLGFIPPLPASLSFHPAAAPARLRSASVTVFRLRLAVASGPVFRLRFPRLLGDRRPWVSIFRERVTAGPGLRSFRDGCRSLRFAPDFILPPPFHFRFCSFAGARRRRFDSVFICMLFLHCIRCKQIYMEKILLYFLLSFDRLRNV